MTDPPNARNERSADPYEVLGIPPDASDAALRSAYRRLVQVHHPDHNNGSSESSRRFEAIQSAYARVIAERRAAAAAPVTGSGPRDAAAAPVTGPGPRDAAEPPVAGPRRGTPSDQREVDARVAAMERELYEARLAQARAREAARDAAREAAGQPRPGPGRATPEELGYVTTDDTVGKIFDDAGDALSKRWSRSRGRSFADRLAGLFGDATETDTQERP